MTLHLILPWPPSVNHYWRHWEGKTLISRQGREYRRRVAEALRGVACIHEDVAVSVEAYPPDNRRRDLDNILKALLDSLTASAVWGDDSQVCDLHIVRRFPIPGGRLDVEIRESRQNSPKF